MISHARPGRSCRLSALAIANDLSFVPHPAAYADDCLVVFQRKIFIDTGNEVTVSGSLPDVLGYKYNTVTIDCHKDQNMCSVIDMESIGSATNGVCQLSRIDPPLLFDVQQWWICKIVANLPGLLCGGGDTWVIDRRARDRGSMTDRWKKPAHSNLVGELKFMLPEMLFQKALWEFNRTLWFLSSHSISGFTCSSVLPAFSACAPCSHCGPHA